MEYSLDGQYLASGSGDGSIRIWLAESLHTTTSKPHMERPARTSKQADTILEGSSFPSMALSFSRTESNLLASGGFHGEIKVWNIKEQACIHSFHPRLGAIRSLFFAGGADSTFIAVTQGMDIIRLWRAEGSSDFASETISETDLGGSSLHYSAAAFSPSGSFVAASFGSRSRSRNESTLALYESETMTKTQSVVIPVFPATRFAVSPDNKQLVVVCRAGRIRLLQTDDLSIQRDMDATGEAKVVCSVAFDPACRVLAFGYYDGGLELRSL
jgi:WD40 repeat protein